MTIHLNLTYEQKQRLARAMVPPVRCRGLNYDVGGGPYYQVGKRRLHPDDYRALCERLSLGTDGD